MATEKIKRPASGSYSAGGGKFYFQAAASFTASAISVSLQIVVTDAFEKSHTASCTFNGKTKKKTVRKKKTYTLGTVQVKSQSVPKIHFACAGKKADIAAGTIRNTKNYPNAPSVIAAELINDARIDLTVTGTGYATVPTTAVEIERCRDVYDENGFAPIPSSPFAPSAENGSYIVSASDQSAEIERGHRYWFRARAYNSTAQKHSKYVYSGTAEDPLYTSSNNDALSGSITAGRISNNQVRLIWTIASVSYVNNRLLESFEVFRSADGGAAVKIADVAADTEHVQYEYLDEGESGPAPDHKYTYQIKGKGRGQEAEVLSESSEEVWMSPARPRSVAAASHSSGDVIITIVNESNTATAVCLERRIDGGSWTLLTEEEYVSGGQTITDDSAIFEDTLEYRARNRCENLEGADAYSEYVNSAAVASRQVPNPPTLRSPVSGSSVSLDAGAVTFSWQHNARDGSSQEEAHLRYRRNGGSWTVLSFTTESAYRLSIASGFSAQDEITWQVRTRGAHPDFSDWSEEAEVRILTKPELTFTAPETGSVIGRLPVDLAFRYSDLSGTLQKLTVDIQKDGVRQQQFSVPVGEGEPGSYEYSLSGFLFENGTVYGLTATALSSTGFTSVSDISVSIEYEEVSLEGGLIPVVSFDEDGVATIVAERDVTEEEGEEAEIAGAYLYRLHDRRRSLVAAGLDEGMLIRDRYAPINIPFSYELLMLTGAGEVSIVTVEVEQESSLWFVYWDGGTARAEWNPEGQISLKRPEKTQVRYSGREYPVSYDSRAMEETFSFSAVILDREELDNFRQMMRDGGRGIWKSGDGDVYDADFEFSYSSDYRGNERQYSCTLNVTRIDGGK